MANDVEFLYDTSGESASHNYVGGSSRNGDAVAKGICPFCGIKSSFRQIGSQTQGSPGRMVAVRCDGCHSISSIAIEQAKLYPDPKVDGVDDLPENIDTYYQEALRCIAADAPSGAATLFRKVIHALAIHYEIANIDTEMNIYSMIEQLDEAGRINPNLRKSLLATKDIGNDGAHINNNEPTIEQALALKGLIDAVLEATVKTDQRVELAREKHPNKYADDS